MRPALKPLSAQTIVITGATSGLGLATTRLAAARGAKLLLTARNEQALRALCEELHARGGLAAYVVADVADEAQVRAVAARADALYGGFDTWINNAGVGLYGKLEDTPLEDQRRLFDTNYWGVVNGSLVAAEHLKARPGGGVLINVGSVLSDVAIPVQGAYAASKHAVKGFTNALRMELGRETPQISVTLVKPGALDTPYREHARNYAGSPMKNPPPVYSTPLAAEAVLYAAEHRIREITVGGAGWILTILNQAAPALIEPMLAWAVPVLSRGGEEAATVGGDALHKPGRGLRERVPYFGVRQTSLFTAARMKPQVTLPVLAAAGVAAAASLLAIDALRLHRARSGARKKVQAELKR
ncbi:MAG: SDR family oxidoreductase [Caulobacteraceae bacterium]